MKKNKFITVFFMLIFSIFGFISCDNLENLLTPQNSSCTLIFNLPNVKSTLQSSTSNQENILQSQRKVVSNDESFLDFPDGQYEITVQNSQESDILYTKSNLKQGTTVYFEDLKSGTYNITGKFLDNSECVAFGKISVQIKSSEDSKIIDFPISLNKESRIILATPPQC